MYVFVYGFIVDYDLGGHFSAKEYKGENLRNRLTVEYHCIEYQPLRS